MSDYLSRIQVASTSASSSTVGASFNDTNSISITGAVWDSSQSSIWVSSPQFVISNGTPIRYKKPKQPKKKRGDKTDQNSPDLRLQTSPLFFFKIIKKNLGILEGMTLDSRMDKISYLMQEFTKSGQIALKDMLDNKFRPLFKEQEIYAAGFKKYIDKKKLSRFMCLTKRQTDITPIKNYARIIPKSVLRVKEKADVRNLFDGYVILHTTSKDAKMLTDAEKKDPILFGVINNSDRLYFLADWEDELCDLRFSEVIDTLSITKDEYTMGTVDTELQKVVDALK